MFCGRCGNKSYEGNRFCESCGAKLASIVGETSADEFDKAKKNYDNTVFVYQGGSDDSDEVLQESHFYESEEFLQGLYHDDSDETLHGWHQDDLDEIYYNPSEFRKETYKNGAYRDFREHRERRSHREHREHRERRSHREHRDNNVKKKHFALLVFIACTFVIAIGFGILFLLGGDETTTSGGESSDVAYDTEVESSLDDGSEPTTEEPADEPEPSVEEVADDMSDTEEDEGMILIGRWEGSFISRWGTAYDLIIGIDSNYQVTATYFETGSRATILARYYGVAQRRGNDEVIIEYTSSSIRPAGWDESGITLFGTIEDNRISGFFEFEGAQTGTARLRMDDLPTAVDAEQLYRIRLTWEDAASQIGAFADLSNAINATPEGYSVFDGQGNVIFTR